MAKLRIARMHLTDDDVHTIYAGRTQHVEVRIRVWRRMGSISVVLVEPANPGGKPIRAWVGHIARHVDLEVMKGNMEYAFVEHDGEGDEERWDVVNFEAHRLGYHMGPSRSPLDRRDVEFQVGGSV